MVFTSKRSARTTSRRSRRRGSRRNRRKNNIIIIHDWKIVSILPGKQAQLKSDGLPFLVDNRPYKLLALHGEFTCEESTIASIDLTDPDISTVTYNCSSGPIVIGSVPQRVVVRQKRSTDFVPASAGTGILLANINHSNIHATKPLIGTLKCTYAISNDILTVVSSRGVNGSSITLLGTVNIDTSDPISDHSNSPSPGSSLTDDFQVLAC